MHIDIQLEIYIYINLHFLQEKKVAVLNSTMQGTQELEHEGHHEIIVCLLCLYELFLLSNCKRLKKKKFPAIAYCLALVDSLQYLTMFYFPSHQPKQ